VLEASQHYQRRLTIRKPKDVDRDAQQGQGLGSVLPLAAPDCTSFNDYRPAGLR
jgi:hypothetical protein